MNTNNETLSQVDVPDVVLLARRKKLFALLGLVITVAALAYGSYWSILASHLISTDNAYVAAEIAQVTPEVDGTVRTVSVVDTQQVKQGDVLVTLNNSDAKLVLAQAEADLARADRRVQSYFANDVGLAAQVQARNADQVRAAAQLVSTKSDMERALIDLNRRQVLASNGSVSGEELSNAGNALAVAEANYRAAEAGAKQSEANYRSAVESLKSSQTLTANTTVTTNPEVALASAKRDQARLDLERTVIRAPIDGIVAKRQVQIGQHVQAGSILLSVVPLQNVHVDANFKEVQLKKVRIGQLVTLTADLYGNSVVYHGKVAGLSAGSGSSFAVIPSQNATGNWIKVVQRLPVRITLAQNELLEHPLQVGLSMTATIDTSN